MTDLDRLESLTNSELREKCVQYGLPNVPVTDSSRKLLIRRLHAALNPQAVKPAKKGNRRETMASTKVANKTTESISHVKRSPVVERRYFHGGMEQSRVPIAATESFQPAKKSPAPERRSFHGEIEKLQNRAFSTNTAEMVAPDNRSYWSKYNNNNPINQQSTVANDVMLKQRLQHLTMTQPSIISHVNNNNIDRIENSYSDNLNKQTTKKQSLRLPELVNDSRLESVSPKITTTTDIGDEITTIYTQKTPTAYSTPHTSFTPLSKSPTLYPRLDDLFVHTVTQPRLNRSNSLSKSGIVTTSFTQETASLPSLGENVEMSPPKVDIEEPMIYNRFENNFRKSPLFNRKSFQPTLNSTSFIASEGDSMDKYRSLSPKRRTITHDVATYSGSSSSGEENSFSDVDYSSDEDDIALAQNPPSYLEKEPKDISLGEFLKILDSRYHLKPFAVMTGCLLLAVFIYTFFLPHYP